MHPRKLQRIAQSLKGGGVIAYPTETLWGLGCLPNDAQALLALASIKQRQTHKGFILISPNIELLLPYFNKKYKALALKHVKLNHTQPTTWLVPKAANLPALLTGSFHTVAVRISPHPFIQDICSMTQTPLVSTSANLSSRPSLNSSLLIRRHFGTTLSHIVTGYHSDSKGKASSIIDLATKNVIR